MMGIRARMLAMGVVVALWGTMARAEFVITDTDRVVFYGDKALVGQGIGLYVEQFAAIRYPLLKARFSHATPFGRPTAEEGLVDFDKIVAELKPTWVVLSFGSAETTGKPLDAAMLDRYSRAMSDLIDKCASIGAKAAVVTPPMPEVSQKKILQGIKYDEVISQYAAAVQSVCEKKGALLLDWHGAMKKLSAERGGGSDPAKLTKDGVIPNDEALGLGVNLLLKAWKADPIEVSITLDWATGTVEATGCQIQVMAPPGIKNKILNVVGIPAVWPISARKNPFPENSPACDFVNMQLKVLNAPNSEMYLATPGTAHWPVSRSQFEAGYDLSSGSPLFDVPGTKLLYDRINDKNDAYKSLLAFGQRQSKQPAPEPELVPAYESHRQAWLLAVEGWNKVLGRTPRTLEVSFDVGPAE